MKSVWIALFGIGICAGLIVATTAYQSKQKPQIVKNPAELAIVLSDDLEKAFGHKLELVSNFLQDPVIAQALRKSALENKNRTADELQEQDSQWQKTPVERIPFLQNDCARKLKEFQNANAAFAEIFITDAQGFNVCQTGKTTDYYQADEAWWQKAFNNGRGKSYHGNIEYDKSSKAEGIAIYVPVFDTPNLQLIGICKAVVNILEVKREL